MDQNTIRDESEYDLSRDELRALNDGRYGFRSIKTEFLWPGDVTEGRVFGVDISHHQGSIDWPHVCKANPKFCYVRTSLGMTVTDRTHQENLNALKDTGIRKGVYHFLTIAGSGSGQAERLVRHYEPFVDDDDLAPCIDFENYYPRNKTEPNLWETISKSERIDKLAASLEKLEELTGRSPIIYTNGYHWRHLLGDEGDQFSKYAIWIARYGGYQSENPNIMPGFWWWMWQFTSSGKMPGITENTVDSNILVEGGSLDYPIPPSNLRSNGWQSLSGEFGPDERVEESAKVARNLEDFLDTPDHTAEPSPDEIDIASEDELHSIFGQRVGRNLDQVEWPDDRDAPDFRYVAEISEPSSCVLNDEILKTLVDLNFYEPTQKTGHVAIALRGATLVSGHEEIKKREVTFNCDRPDHRNFKCLIGFWQPEQKSLTLFSASTVPCRAAVWGYAHGGTRSNLLPTGMWRYYVWRHRDIRPALRLGESSSNPETGAYASVLRNLDNNTLDTIDKFDYSKPIDNIHCSYFLDEQEKYGAAFSSWGCLTVRGEKTPSDQWKKFQEVLGKIGERQPVDLLLTTGKDVALIADGLNSGKSLEYLRALRPGSTGSHVKRLQRKIGVQETGYFGPKMSDIFTRSQRKIFKASGYGSIADGIYSRSFEELSGWNIFGRNNGVGS